MHIPWRDSISRFIAQVSSVVGEVDTNDTTRPRRQAGAKVECFFKRTT
jgi:hypothetical protein